MKIWNWLISGCIFLSLFFHEAGKTNEKLIIIATDHCIGKSSRPDSYAFEVMSCYISWYRYKILCLVSWHLECSLEAHTFEYKFKIITNTLQLSHFTVHSS